MANADKSKLKRTVPTYLFNETEKAIISERIPYKLVDVIVHGKKVNCIEFNEDVFNVLEDIETSMILEAASESDKRAMAIRISTITFQSIRELTNIQGNSIKDLMVAARVVGRLAGLACVVGLANLSYSQANRLIPLVRSM